ncbi:MAG: glutathione S-transferase family protein [Lautropia sp.]
MLELFGHPFSSYCQKALIALYEHRIDFTWRRLSPDDPQTLAAWAAHWPMQRMPVLVDDGTPVFEATIIVEHLDLHHARGRPLVPADPVAALDVRFMDRFFDNYVATPQQRVVFNALRDAPDRDPLAVRQANAMLDTSYAWLERRMEGREWASGGQFSLADCSAAPQLFYADWTHPIGDRFPNVLAYRRRLLARPSVARCVDEARPYRAGFPLGAPDRD